MRTSPPTVFDVSRYRLLAAEYFRRASEAATPEARDRLEQVARQFVVLAGKAELAIAMTNHAAPEHAKPERAG
jgi:hypothetical protein